MPLSLLFIGKLQAGKSYLVNIFRVGETEAREGKGRNASTSKVEGYDAIIGNVDAILWDTPGLQPENYQSCLKELSTTIKQIDLIVYCIKMDDAQFHLNDREAIQHVTKAFGNEIWNHAMIALTFGNKMADPDDTSDEEYFSSMLQSWQDIIREYLLKCTVKESVVQEIPFIPVGSRRRPKLAENKDWKETFVAECLKRATAYDSPMRPVYKDGGARKASFSLCGTLGRYIKTARDFLKGRYTWAGFGVCICTVFALLICIKICNFTGSNMNLIWCQKL